MYETLEKEKATGGEVTRPVIYHLSPFCFLFSSHSSAFFFPGEGQSRPGPWEVLVMKCSQFVLKGMWHLPQIFSFLFRAKHKAWVLIKCSGSFSFWFP